MNYFMYSRDTRFFVGAIGFHSSATASRYADKRGLEVVPVCGWKQYVGAVVVLVCCLIC